MEPLHLAVKRAYAMPSAQEREEAYSRLVTRLLPLAGYDLDGYRTRWCQKCKETVRDDANAGQPHKHQFVLCVGCHRQRRADDLDQTRCTSCAHEHRRWEKAIADQEHGKYRADGLVALETGGWTI